MKRVRSVSPTQRVVARNVGPTGTVDRGVEASIGNEVLRPLPGSRTASGSPRIRIDTPTVARTLDHLPQEMFDRVLSHLGLPDLLATRNAGPRLFHLAGDRLARAILPVMSSPDIGPPDEIEVRQSARWRDPDAFDGYMDRVTRGLADMDLVPARLRVAADRQADRAPGEAPVIQGRALLLTRLVESVYPDAIYGVSAFRVLPRPTASILRTLLGSLVHGLGKIEPAERTSPLAALVLLAMHVDAAVLMYGQTRSSAVALLAPHIAALATARPEAAAWLRVLCECRHTPERSLGAAVDAWMDIGTAKPGTAVPPWKLRLLDVPYLYLTSGERRFDRVFLALHRVACAVDQDAWKASVSHRPSMASRLLRLAPSRIVHADGPAAETDAAGRFMDIVERVDPEVGFMTFVAEECLPRFSGQPTVKRLAPARRAVAWMISNGSRQPPEEWLGALEVFVEAVPPEMTGVHAVEAEEAMDVYLRLVEHLPPARVQGAMEGIVESWRFNPEDGRPTVRYAFERLLGRAPDAARAALRVRLDALCATPRSAAAPP